MAEATVRDLRNTGGEILDRVAAGEHVTVTLQEAESAFEPLPFDAPAARAFGRGIDGLDVVELTPASR